KLRRAPGQGVLDPEALGDTDKAHRSIREINHQERQILHPQGADRCQQRILDLLPPIGGRCGLAGVHRCRLPPVARWDHAGLPMTPQASRCPCPHGFGASATQSIYKLSKTAPPPFNRREDVLRSLHQGHWWVGLWTGCGHGFAHSSALRGVARIAMRNLFMAMTEASWR